METFFFTPDNNTFFGTGGGDYRIAFFRILQQKPCIL